MAQMKPEKKFDAVKWMREARERLNAELQGKSFEEQRRYIEQRLAEQNLERDSSR